MSPVVSSFPSLMLQDGYVVIRREAQLMDRAEKQKHGNPPFFQTFLLSEKGNLFEHGEGVFWNRAFVH